MNDLQIEIGNILANLGETKYYYIGRTFNRYIKIKENLIKEKSKFFITHNSQVTELNLQQDQDIVMISNEDNFEELCKKYEKHNIHWLTNDLVWKKSYSSLFKLRHFIDIDKLIDVKM